MQKRGELSRLSVNLLIGSLIIILGVIIWIILRGGSENNQEVFTDENIDLKISQVKKINDNTLDVTLKRNLGEGEFVGLSFVVNDGSLIEVIRINSSMPENQTGNFSLKFISMNASRVKKISVTPIYLNEEGVEVIGNVKDEYVTPNTCSNYCPTGSQCGLNDCGMQCGNGCGSGYLCLNYKCIKQQTFSGGGGSGGSSGGSTEDNEDETCTDTCDSLVKQCGIQTICEESVNCGTCLNGYVCSSGLCVLEETCTDTCNSLNYNCGTHFICGSSVNCGTCSTGYTCQVNNGTCMRDYVCTPTCSGKNCGSDGCGGSCGVCNSGYTCQTNGTCIRDDISLKYIVQNGVGYADIVVASNAPNMVKLAAEYFQMYIYNMTGVRLPISNSVNQSKSYHIYIGRSSYTDSLGITSQGCVNDGFKMVSGTNYLVLLGDDNPHTLLGPDNFEEWDALTGDTWGNDFIRFYPGQENSQKDIWKTDGSGSMNAVFEFLYDQGIRWYAPGEIGIVIPEKSSVGFGNINVLKNPEYPMRSFMIYYKEFSHLSPHLYPDYENILQWVLSLRSNHYFEFMVGADGGPGHGILAVISRDEKKTEHPEYYAILNGVRMNGDNPVPDLCSQGLLQENVRYAKAMFDLYNVSIVSVMPTDGFQGPSESSAACLAMENMSRGWESALSDYTWEYVNNVAWEIYNDPKYSGKKILNAAYPPYLFPPEHLSKPIAPNLVVMITRWRSDFASEQEKQKYLDLKSQWLAILPSKELYTYDYYLHNRPDGFTQGIPSYFPHIIAEDLNDLKSNSKGEFMEVYSNWPLDNRAWDTFAATSFNIYVTARAYWDTNLDVDALLNEYYNLYYGPASSQMKAFVEYSEENYVRALEDPTVLRTMRSMLANARSVAGNTIYGERIDLLIDLMNSDFDGNEVNINSCGTLDSPTTTYKLTSDVSSTGTCFIINHVGITLDCQGHTITYGNGRGIAQPYWYNNGNSLIIKNCNIRSSGSTTGNGIELAYCKHVKIENTNITTANTGVWLVNDENMSMINNRIVSSSDIPLSTQTVYGGTITRNILTGNSDWGMYLYDTHNMNITWNNVSCNTARAGAMLMRSNYNTLTDNRFISNGGPGLSQSECYGNVLLRNIIS